MSEVTEGTWRTAVAYWGGGGVVWDFQTPPKFRSFNKAEPISQFLGKYIHNNPNRIRFHSFANWAEPLTRGLLHPDPHSLCPLSSTEFVEPPEKNSWRNPPPKYNSWVHHCIQCWKFLSWLTTCYLCSKFFAAWSLFVCVWNLLSQTAEKVW
jgi:hypothetical protein